MEDKAGERAEDMYYICVDVVYVGLNSTALAVVCHNYMNFTFMPSLLNHI